MHPQRVHSNRRIALAVTLTFFFILSLSRNFLGRGSLPTSKLPALAVSRIDGRWRAVHSSLGLPVLPDMIPVAPPPPPPPAPRIVISRFDLRKRKRDSTAKPIQQLYFTSDALEEPSLSLEQLSKSFLAVALTEKGIEGNKFREQEQRRGAQRNERRPNSWSKRGMRD
jgi:hypothetical protein